MSTKLITRLLRVMRVTDSMTEMAIQLGAFENHLSRMHRFHSIERDRKITCVLDVDQELRAAIGRHRADRAKLFAAIRYKGLETNFDVLLHDSLLAVITTRLYRAVRTRAKDHPAAW